MQISKKALSLLLLVTFSVLTTYAQDVNSRIREQFTAYNQLIIDKNFDKALDHTNEGIFKTIPRETMLMLITKAFDAPGMIIKANIPMITDFKPGKFIDGQNYVKFTSNTAIQMKIIDEPSDDPKSDADKKLTLSLQKVAFINKFGGENVSYDDATGFFTLRSKKTVIANSDEKLTNWKFTVIENGSSRKLLETFIPAELLQ